MNKLYKDKDWLYQKYVIEKLSIKKIGILCGISFSSSRYWLKKYGILLREQGNRLPLGQASFNGLYAIYKEKAKRRNIEFSLTKEQFRKLTKQNCHYCGEEPRQIAWRSRCLNGAYLYNGIDRIDSNKAYVMENSVPCCKHCNWAKNDSTTEEFKAWVRRAYKYMEEHLV